MDVIQNQTPSALSAHSTSSNILGFQNRNNQMTFFCPQQTEEIGNPNVPSQTHQEMLGDAFTKK